MFRIKFNHKTARFEAQVLQFDMFWRTVKGNDFATYDDARLWVRAVGLDQWADEQLFKGRPNFVTGMGVAR